MMEKHPSIIEARVELTHHSIARTPFAAWATQDAPRWWSANNKVKHARDTDFNSASLVNAIDAVSALLIVSFYRHEVVEGKADFELARVPRLFNIDCFISSSIAGTDRYLYGTSWVHEAAARRLRSA